MTNRPITKPAVVDRRAERLATIDAEINRLQALCQEKRDAIALEESKHPLDQDTDLLHHLGKALSGARDTIQKFRDERIRVELGEAEQVGAAPARAAPTAKDWDLEADLPQQPPAYPKGARVEGKIEVINEAFDGIVEWFRQKRLRTMFEVGIHPDKKADFHTLGVIVGQLDGVYHWLSYRCAEAEERLAELTSRLEAMESHGVRYVGTWQRAQAYGKGMVVTSDGSLWVALRATAEGEQPGKAIDAWQLAAKGTRT